MEIKDWINIAYIIILIIVFIIQYYQIKKQNSLLSYYDKIFNIIKIDEIEKYVKLKEDLLGEDARLAYVRDKEKREVDFALVGKNNVLEKLVEVKLSEKDVDKSLKYFTEKLNITGVQVIKNIRAGQKVNDRIEIREAVQFLSSL